VSVARVPDLVIDLALNLDLDLDLGAALAHLDEHGFARLGRLIDPAALALLRERADDLMLGRHRVEGLFFQADSPSGAYADLEFGRGWVGPSLGYRKLEKLERDDRFRALIASPPFERIARARIAGDIAIYRAVLFTKARGGGTELPWHQDGGRFWGVDRDPTLQIWTALDDPPRRPGDPRRRKPTCRPRRRRRRRRARRPPARGRRRGHPPAQPPLAPLAPQRDRPAPSSLHGLLHECRDSLSPHSTSAAQLLPPLRLHGDRPVGSSPTVMARSMTDP
jgi:hypothetical protein